MSFVRKFIACLISIALVLAQLSATARGISIDIAGNGSVLSLGINGSKGSASRKWTSPSGIVTQGSLDVIVENATRLKGAVIASQTNDLQLSTRTLSTQDIALYDNDRQVSGSIGINTTINGPNGPNGPKPSKPGFNINATYANKQIKGIARATISGGQIEVTSQTGKQTARQLASLNRNADKSLEITSVIDEGFELYLSDTSLQAAFKAGAKIRDVLEELLFRLGEKQLSKELGSKDLPLEHALAQLRENCHVSQQGFNILEFFVGTAYAAQGCVIETLSGKPVVIHDTDNCYWAVFSALWNQARALGKAKFRAGLQDGLIELGDEFVELAKDPGKVFDDLKGIVYALIKDPHGTAIKLGVTIADDIYTKALQYASALANEDYTKAGKLAAALSADLILKVALPVAGVTITAAKAASGFNKLTKKFTFDDKGPNGANRGVNFKPSQVQKKYNDHAADFGVTGNYNKANGEKFQTTLQSHVGAPTTKPIVGTYKKNPVTHYVNPNTGLNVMKGPNGNFISGWKLNPAQLKNVLERGSL